MLICSFLPMVIFLLFGGVAVDRLSRTKIMFASDLGRGIIVAGVAALSWSGTLQIWEVYILSVMFGLVDAFFRPAYAAAVPEIVPPELLPSANSLTSLSTQGGRIVGPAIAAAVISIGGIPLAFFLNALSFFAAAGSLLPLLSTPTVIPALPQTLTRSADKPNLFRDIRQGIGTVAAAPWLWITIALVALCNVTLTGPYSVALPFLIQSRGDGVRTLGLLYAMFPIGYALSAILLGRLHPIRHRGMIAYAGIILAD